MAVVLAGALGALTIYSFPSALSSSTVVTGASTSTSIGTTSFAVTTSTTLFSTTTSTGPPASTTTSIANAAWEPGQVATLVLESSVVQSYIGSAYSYHIGDMKPSPSNPNLITVSVNVTGAQSVNGNWTTGYEVSYTGLRTLTAEVLFNAPSSFTLQNVAVTELPGVNQSVAYDSQQQQIVRVALSNATGIIKGLMGSAAFYVDSVTSVPLQNGTYAGDYFVFIYQVDGPKLVGVFVNGGITAVVDSYTATNAETMCFTLGTAEGTPASANEICYTSPWNESS